MQDKLNALIEKHCATIKVNVEAVGAELRRIEQGCAMPAEALKEAVGLAHQLKGSSGTAGFHDICVAATALYDHLNRLGPDRETSVWSDIGQAAGLFEALDHIARQTTPRSSTLYVPVAADPPAKPPAAISKDADPQT